MPGNNILNYFITCIYNILYLKLTQDRIGKLRKMKKKIRNDFDYDKGEKNI